MLLRHVAVRRRPVFDAPILKGMVKRGNHGFDGTVIPTVRLPLDTSSLAWGFLKVRALLRWLLNSILIVNFPSSRRRPTHPDSHCTRPEVGLYHPCVAADRPPLHAKPPVRALLGHFGRSGSEKPGRRRSKTRLQAFSPSNQPNIALDFRGNSGVLRSPVSMVFRDVRNRFKTVVYVARNPRKPQFRTAHIQSWRDGLTRPG